MKYEDYSFIRKQYSSIAWKSSNGVSTKIVDLDDAYLVNVMRSVSKSITLAEHFPVVEEFQSYEGVTYKDWQKYLSIEYAYRMAEVEKRYNEYVDQQTYLQSVRDSEYYQDYGAASDIY